MPTQPPIACSLSATELPARLAEMADLGRAALLDARTDDGRAVLRFAAGRRRARARRGRCRRRVSMLRVPGHAAVSDEPDAVVLTITGPEGAEPVARRARRARFAARPQARLMRDTDQSSQRSSAALAGAGGADGPVLRRRTGRHRRRRRQRHRRLAWHRLRGHRRGGRRARAAPPHAKGRPADGAADPAGRTDRAGHGRRSSSGTAIERNSSGESGHEGATTTSSEAGTSSGENHAQTSGETPATHANESADATAEPAGEFARASLRPLGIDVEAWPFVALAALASLALALAAWLRPGSVALLAFVALAMLVFAVLDVREVVHQSDIDETGLAVLAAFIAALHSRPRSSRPRWQRVRTQPHTGPPGAADTMPA